MHGPDILARTLSESFRPDDHGRMWQYNSRSDRHSKVACWSIVFDLLCESPLLRRHVASGAVCFGINHRMRDFVQDREKSLDLVLCTPADGADGDGADLCDLADDYDVRMSATQRDALAALPALRRGDVGNVLLALEAKACMTAHQKALPRLYDELNSSHLTVHGATDQAIAAGFVMVNVAERFLSSIRNDRGHALPDEWSHHRQPKAAEITVAKVRQLPRRSGPGRPGYDALAIVAVDCANDGTEVRVVSDPPAPATGDIHHYDTTIGRLAHAYATRFKEI